MADLNDKFKGCIAATWIGSSMGAVVEGWSRERIKETYGYFDKLVEYRHYENVTDWTRKPGTTEDGIERQKLIATVESVLDAAKEFVHYRVEGGSLYALYDTIEMEVGRALGLAAKHTDPMAMRDEFYDYYQSTNFFNYHMSQANEVVSKGLAVFAVTEGDPKESILVSVNFGRDTDCLAAVAAGLAGALSGASSLPAQWVDQVNKATEADRYTNNKRTIEQTVDGLFQAYQAKNRIMQDYLELMAGARSG